MLVSTYTTPKFWKELKLTTARKACPKESLEYRDAAKRIIYADFESQKERGKEAKPYRRDVQKVFDWMVVCLDRLGYVYAVEDAHSGQTGYISTYHDPEYETNDGEVDAPVTYKEKTNYNEIFELSFQLAALKWCEQNYEYAFADRTTGTIINVSNMLDLEDGDANSKSFTTHSDAVTDSLRNNLYSRMGNYGLLYLLVGKVENSFTRAHREIYEALVAKDAPRLQTVLNAKWR